MEFHVVFFGKPVSRAWLRTDGVRPFTGNCNMNDGTNVSTCVSVTFLIPWYSFVCFSPVIIVIGPT